MKFPVIVNKSEYGYDVHCPTLKGCHSQGETLEEALDNIKDAIEQYLAALKELHQDEKLYEVEVAV
ncbi:MAG: type II toxin-antitoxin system HicB family antitoxin [bacterium]